MLETLKSILSNYIENFEELTLTEETRFIEDLSFNSYMYISMIGDVEDEFEIDIEDTDDVTHLMTIKDLMTFIQKKKGEETCA